MEKIPKFQNSKIPYKKFFGILMLLGLLFSGCKQLKELEPEPKTAKSQAQIVLQAKQWFQNQKRKQNPTKSTADTLLASREPDWQNATYYLIATDSMASGFLEMPLLYAGKYEVNKQAYPDGKKGRGYTKLVLKQLSATEFQPVVMRFYADSVYLTQPHPPLSQNLFGSFDPNFTGEALFYDWEQENFMGANRFQNGILTESATQNQGGYQEKVECAHYAEIIYYTLTPEPDTPLARNNKDAGGSYIRTRYVCWWTVTSPCTSCGSSVGLGGNGGGGYNPMDNPNTPIAPPYQFSDAFKKIVDSTKTNMKDPDVQLIDKEVERLYRESCLFKCMIDQLSNAPHPVSDPANPNKKFRVGFQVKSNMSGTGQYDNYTQTVNINYAAVGGKAFSAIINEELIHAYQDIFDSGFSRNIPPNGKGVPNVEVDAKLLIDIDNYCYKINTGKLLHQKEYLVTRGKENLDYTNYLKSITNTGTEKPNNIGKLNPTINAYKNWLDNFRTIYAGSPYDKPIDYNKQPDALLRLVLTCNCN